MEPALESAWTGIDRYLPVPRGGLVDAGALLTVAEVADRLKVSQETVREWLRAGELGGYNLGGQAGWRIPEVEIDRLLAARMGKRRRHERPKEG
jgi:excisionase family DNA binding protein